MAEHKTLFLYTDAAEIGDEVRAAMIEEKNRRRG
jgi:hypothetical protein